MSKQTYIVLKQNTLGHNVGDSIDLTESEADFLVNKIRLKDDVQEAEVDPRTKSAGYKKRIAELETELADERKQKEAFYKENVKLKGGAA